jgi:hypothetical protein
VCSLSSHLFLLSPLVGTHRAQVGADGGSLTRTGVHAASDSSTGQASGQRRRQRGVSVRSVDKLTQVRLASARQAHMRTGARRTQVRPVARQAKEVRRRADDGEAGSRADARPAVSRASEAGSRADGRTAHAGAAGGEAARGRR